MFFGLPKLIKEENVEKEIKNNNLDNKIMYLKDVKKLLEKVRDQYNEKNKDWISRFNHLEDLYDKVCDENKNYIKINEELQLQLETKDENIQSVIKDLERLQKDYDEVNIENETLLSANKELQEKANENTTIHNVAKDFCDNLQQSVHEAINTSMNKDKEIEELKAKIKDFEDIVDDKCKEIEDLKKEIERCENDYKRASTTIIQKEETLTKYRETASGIAEILLDSGFPFIEKALSGHGIDPNKLRDFAGTY